MNASSSTRSLSPNLMYNCDMVKGQFLSGIVHFFVMSITTR